MIYPPLPRSIAGLAGPIRIDRPLRVEKHDGDTVGMWLPRERRITVQATISREVGWAVLMHELAHSYVYDTGIAVTHAKEEAICDAMASGFMHVIRQLLTR